MKNLNVNQKLLSALLTGALSLSLVGCGHPKKEYVSFQDIFYDENVEGVDDTFEGQITDSNLQIANIEKLEKSMELIPQLMEIDYRDVEVTLSKEEVSQNYQDVSMEQLDNIEEQINSYYTMIKGSNSMMEDPDIIQLKSELYHQLIYLINYVRYSGKTTLFHFGNRLYDSIFLETSSYAGGERNVEARVGVSKGSSVPPLNYVSYSYGEENELVEIPVNSQYYYLVSEVGSYQDYQELPETMDLYIRYDSDIDADVLEMIKQYQETLNLYKESMVTSYELVPHKGSFLEEAAYDMDLLSHDTDTSSIIKK